MSTDTTAIEDVAGNEDLLRQILVRLPAAALITLKLVSKRWCSLISDPQFVRAHSCWKPNKLAAGILYFDGKYRSDHIRFVSFTGEHPFQTIPPLGFLYDVADFLNSDEIKILQSCNGLLLCVLSTHLNSYQYLVCNLTTKKYRLIGNVWLSISGRVTFTLAFDPSASLDYKVVMTSASSPRIGSGGTCEISIYSSEDNCWRRCDSSPFEPLGVGLFLNSSIYWFEFHKEHSLCFDVSLKKLVQVAVPPPKTLDYYYKSLAVSGNHLNCIGKSNDDATSFCVLEMASDFSGWFTKYKFSVCPIVDIFPEVHFVLHQYGNIVHRMSLLCLVEGVKEEDLELVFAIPGKVISYNLMKGAVKEIAHLDGELAATSEYGYVRAFEFVESLILV